MKGKLLCFAALILLLISGTVGEYLEPATTEGQYEHDKEGKTNDGGISLSFSIFFCVFVCLTLRHWFSNCNLPIPYGAFTILLGLLWGLAAQNFSFVGNYSKFYTNVVTFLYFYVPSLMFKVAFCIDFKVFRKAAIQIAIISLPAYLVQSLITGFFMRYILREPWPSSIALLFGVLCTAVYPMDVVRHLNNMGTYTKSITLLLEGEAMSGLSTGIIVAVLIEGFVTDVAVHWYQILCLSLRFIFMGIVIGYVLGYIFCFIMRTICFDVITLLVLTLSAPLVSFNIVTSFCGLTGTVTVIVIGLMMSTERPNLTPETNRILNNVWEMVVLLNTTIMSLTAGIMTAYHTIPHLNWLDLWYILLTYTVTNLSRLVSFTLFLPILRRIGVGLSVRNMAICVWGGIKSRVSLAVVLLVYENYEWDLPFQRVFVMHTVIIYWLSLFINGTSLPLLCELLKISEATLARHVNMNNCIMYIYARKHQAIHIIKMDRFMADVNWPYVKELTVLKPPYDQPFHYKRDHKGYFLDYSIAYYPGVNRNLPFRQQMIEKVRAERIKVSNAKKIYYSRQFENGMVSSEVYKILISLDSARDTQETLVELDRRYKMFQKENWAKQLFRIVVNKFNTEDVIYRPPRSYWRRKCYRFICSKVYQILKYLILISNVIYLVIDISYRRHFKAEDIDRYKYFDPLHLWYIMLIHIFFYLVDLCEIIVKILAYSWKSIKDGIRIFVWSFWNCILILTTITYTTFFISNVIKSSNKFTVINTHDVIILVIILQKLIRLVEMLSFFDFYNAKILIQSLNAKINTNRILAYELATVFMKGELEIKEALPHLVCEQEILVGIKERMENEMQAVKNHMAIVQKERPWIATTVKTKQAIKFILNGMSEAINDLKLSGWLDDVEYLNLNSSLNEKYKRWSVLRSVQPSPGRVILREVSWMDGETAEYLVERAILKTYQEGDVICRPGRTSEGIYVIVAGLFSLDYEPTEQILQSLNDIGCLPIIDYCYSTDVSKPISEFLLPGDCIGEFSTMTERHYDCTVTASAAQCQVYYLNKSVIKRSCLRDSDNIQGLRNRIWKRISVQIVLHILRKVPAYRSQTQEEMRYTVERAFVPDLREFTSFVVNELMEDVVLIEGMVVDSFNNKTYKGPCYIPRFVKKIMLISSRNVSGSKRFFPQLLIIPVDGVNEYAAMENNTQFEIVTTYSSQCLQHLARARAKKSKRNKKSRDKSGKSKLEQQGRPVVLEEIISIKPPPLGNQEGKGGRF